MVRKQCIALKNEKTAKSAQSQFLLLATLSFSFQKIAIFVAELCSNFSSYTSSQDVDVNRYTVSKREVGLPSIVSKDL